MKPDNIAVNSEQDVEKYKIHNFIKKLFQEDIFDKLMGYIDFRIKTRQGSYIKPEKIAPISINLDLITACNYYCDHCIDLEILNNGHLLKFENIKKIISPWVENGLKSVIVIGGGEPVLHPDFEEVITFLKEKGLELGIASNGSRMSRLAKIAHLLNERDWIRLSLDAGRDETFQRIHNPKQKTNLDRILAEVKKMRQKYSGYQMGFSYLVISDEQVANHKHLVNNIGEIALAAKKAKEKGFSYFSVKPFISPEGHRPTEFQRQGIKEIAKQVKLAKELEDAQFKVIESVNLLALLNDFNPNLRKQPKTCHAQFFRLSVCPDGVFNCTLWRGFEMSYLIDTQQEVNARFFEKLGDSLLGHLENFDASKECGEVSCIYHDFNWFIEEMINHPEKIKYLEKTEDFYDYFL
jgi:wyosine [tRNA(Phe)-imidazoG37] synthetase (radical SAM superfamily)